MPRKLLRWCSQRVVRRRKFCSQANNLSTFHRRLYRRSRRPSWVRGLLRFSLWGATNSVPYSFFSFLSNGSLSYALSPMIKGGTFLVNRCSKVVATSLVSWGEALATLIPIGRPWRSAIAMILVPFPRFVLPTPEPPFLLRRRSHR